MEKNYLTSIRDLFETQKVLTPIPTNIQPRLCGKNNIKCVVFDIYGTLLISASGDINKIDLSPSFILEAFSKCEVDILSENPLKTAEYVVEKYKLIINELKEKRKCNDSDVPEINIREVWEILLQTLYHEKLINRPWIEEVDLLAIHFEILSNPVYPMPFMKEIIESTRHHDVPIGIISNAQFYTPVIMNYLLNGKISDKEDINGFDPDISVFSYKEKLSKPSTQLFKKVLGVCKDKYGFESNEILFVGNDMLKDIYPAKKMGMQTALFAGDSRSLRLRQEDPRLQNLTPDYIVNSLEQIMGIIL